MADWKDELERRMDLWGSNYDHREQIDLMTLTIAAGVWLESLLGAALVDPVMKSLWREVYKATHHHDIGADAWKERLPLPWRAVWEGADLDEQQFLELDAGKRVAALNLYAFFGMVDRKDASEEAQAARIEESIAWMAEFLSHVPENWLDSDGGLLACDSLRSTLQAARARYALDRGLAVRLEQLADLAGVSVKTMRNSLYAKKEGAICVDVDGSIAASAALEWLGRREGYMPSIWRETFRLDTWSAEPDEPGEDLGEYLFVPAGRDGREFSPRLRRPQGYQIGAKGQERWIADYFEALALLSAMHRPSWRRPNEEGSGRWGIVKAERWVRRPKALLLEELQAAGA